jgi:small GTP-binding protein
MAMQIWDTAGQEKYHNIGPIYYRNAAAAVAVFDVTIDNFEQSLDAWIVSVKRTATDPLIFVVGNKIDLIEEDVEHDLMARVKQFGSKYNAVSFFTSAKSGRNIEALFEAVFTAVVRAAEPQPEVFPVEPPVKAVKQECC